MAKRNKNLVFLDLLFNDTPAEKKRKIDAEMERQANELYKLYPIHKAKGAAIPAILKALRKADYAVIHEGLIRFRNSRDVVENLADRDRHQFIKRPATWFNQQCWLDEEPTAPPNPFITELHRQLREER